MRSIIINISNHAAILPIANYLTEQHIQHTLVDSRLAITPDEVTQAMPNYDAWCFSLGRVIGSIEIGEHLKQSFPIR